MFPTGLIAGSAWSSGLNVWAVVALLGIAGRAGWSDTPAVLQRPAVIAVALVLYAVEFVIDKVTFLDSAWDAVNTAVRPTMAAGIALALTPHGTALERTVAVVGAAAAALSSHSAKASLRALVNVSPEPFTNIAVSLGEDGLALAMVAFALRHPRPALALSIAAVVLCAVLVWWAWRTLRRVGGRVFARRAPTA